MNITLLYAPKPRQVIELQLVVGNGCTVQDALKQTGWGDRYPEIAAAAVGISVWGRKAHADTALREGDRLELCRSLRVDPKVARRERFVGQGARGAGLFAQRRPGSKAGY
ncbi:protein rnfH [Hydrogenophaga crassostreae]|uniref:UPF0125 protein LPB072_11800 n=1 Tax=Hydrogenophaga crassostreae TaxID=1763535 RepID=A0A167HTL8_9BURK|nr:RnfH family protein [Hydrogenophaga crassostreae]AOW13432.1 RnfH family protein [Hydrogenophaga crassostreae]OAD41722.1 protein rnfH [Hydrogenophaga crassostreae]